ncbi:MAG: FecR domain-containing protein [Tannerella sp.]|nr:FecR domain-containing protein [Tannerella sp.]
MKYKHTVQHARAKFLKQKDLSKNERILLEKDFSGKDYVYYQNIEGDEILLSEQYSADATYSKIEHVFAGKHTRRSVLKYVAAAVLFICTTISLYYVNSYPKIITVSTSYGEKKDVILPDGSTVMLNSLSSVSYPKKMKDKTREVVLDGEAFFNVVKNDRKTFIVKVQEIEVKVLGTQFNVSAYADDDKIITSLYEGSVAVSLNSGEVFQLRPGEQAIYDKHIKSVEIESFEENTQNWIDGSLCFYHKPLREIWKTLDREKNVSFEISDEVNSDLKITASFNRNDSIEDILDILGQTGEFTFEKTGNLYIIKAIDHE